VLGCAAQEPPPVAEVGTGYESFAALRDGDRVDIYQGPQGGYHVYAAVRTQFMRRDGVALSYSLAPMAPVAGVSTHELTIDLADVGGGDGVAAGTRLVLEQPAAIAGQICALTVRALDRDGREATDRRLVVPEWKDR
jgi:hypothetical protein